MHTNPTIPTGWKLVKIADIAKVYDGTHQTPTYVSEGIPFYSVEHITADDFDNTKYITEKVYENESKRTKIESGDVLMTRIGDIGTAKYINWNVKASFYVTLALIKCIDTVNSKFLTYLINSQNFHHELWKRTLHVAFPNKINLGDINKCPALLPSPSEQSHIVTILEAWDKTIEKLARKIEVKKNIKKGLMQKLLTGQVRLPGFSGEWVSIEVGKVFSFLRTYAISRENLINNTSNIQNIGNIHYGDIHSTYGSTSIDLRSVSVPSVRNVDFTPNENDLLINGDLIMADASEDYEGIGITISIHGMENKKVVGGLHTYVLRDASKKTEEKYRQYIFWNPQVRKQLKKMANGVSVYGISKSNLSKIRLDLPTSPEQASIANILITADKEIEALKKELVLLEDQKKFLLNNLITGKIRTPKKMDC